MVNSNKRADVVLYKGLYNVLTDMRTIAGGDQHSCCAAASSPGYGAAWGAVQKDAAWLAQARSQGDTFLAPRCPLPQRPAPYKYALCPS